MSNFFCFVEKVSAPAIATTYDKVHNVGEETEEERMPKNNPRLTLEMQVVNLDHALTGEVYELQVGKKRKKDCNIERNDEMPKEKEYEKVASLHIVLVELVKREVIIWGVDVESEWLDVEDERLVELGENEDERKMLCHKILYKKAIVDNIAKVLRIDRSEKTGKAVQCFEKGIKREVETPDVKHA